MGLIAKFLGTLSPPLAEHVNQKPISLGNHGVVFKALNWCLSTLCKFGVRRPKYRERFSPLQVSWQSKFAFSKIAWNSITGLNKL